MIELRQWGGGLAEWIEDDTAYLSVAFSWRLNDAYMRAVWYRAQGYRVRAGGPGTFTRKRFLEDVAEVGGDYPDAVVRHHPNATFASRGCPAGCWYCIVPKMEGRGFTLLPDFVPRPVLCDNNLSALPADYQEYIVDRYERAAVALLDANSGFEPGAFDEEVAARWRRILKGPWRFGFDEQSEGREVERVMLLLRKVSPRRKQIYTMIGHEPFELCMDRIRRVIAWGGEPYAQYYVKLNALTKRPDVRLDWTEGLLHAVQRWVNRHLWRTVRFEDYYASAKTRTSRASERDLFGTGLVPERMRAAPVAAAVRSHGLSEETTAHD
jgi:hypothetical protein